MDAHAAQPPEPAGPPQKSLWIYVIMAGTLAALFFFARGPSSTVRVGRDVGPVVFQLANGQALPLASLRGKVVLVNFWATWCPPCVAELPALEQAYSRLHDQIAVVGVSVDDASSEHVIGFARRHGVTFPIARSTDAMRAFGPFDSIPTTFMLGCDGRVRARISGGLTVGSIETEVERARAQSAASCGKPSDAPEPIEPVKTKTPS